jgi:5'-3' exonuclease
MGVPKYFSYVIRNHPNILRNKRQMKDAKIDSLYMDCNSIIYDSIREEEEKTDEAVTEEWAIEAVIRKIDAYVREIGPTNILYIAFDGMAPVAKMEQQRQRRYNALFLSLLDFSGEQVRIMDEPLQKRFNTINITPGTNFMNQLSRRLHEVFIGSEYSYGVNRLILSTSEERGEGEHKIFQFIREQGDSLRDDTMALYGLDSDLIMLSLIHVERVKNIYIFREAPSFIKFMLPVDMRFEKNEHLFIDIQHFERLIKRQLSEDGVTSVREYMILCILLGNDFLPSLACLDLSRNGCELLIHCYKQMNRKIERENGIREGIIEFLKILEKYESEEIMKSVQRELKMKPLNKPTNDYRDIERIKEYRKKCYCIQNIERTKEVKGEYNGGYIEGLEWVYTYYTEGCKNWKWRYKSRVPLIQEIILSPSCSSIEKETEYGIEEYKKYVMVTKI